MDLLSGPDVAAWYYLVVAAALATPLVPNGALVLAGGALAARGELLLPLVWAAVFTGAVGGDLLLYAAARRLPLGRRSTAVRTVAARLKSRGALLVVLRYLPAGRFTGTVGAATGGMRVGGFARAMILAEASWTTLYVALGYGGTTAYTRRPLAALAVAACVILTMALTLRRIRHRMAGKQLLPRDDQERSRSHPAIPPAKERVHIPLAEGVGAMERMINCPVDHPLRPDVIVVRTALPGAGPSR
ncbi:DedA family protein [Streptomyces sp. NPDC002526]